MPAPFVEELRGPGGRVVNPELLKGFLEKVGPDSLEVVAQEIAQPEVLVGAEILAAAEQQPTGLLEDRGARPSRFMRLVSSARTLSSALFILATMWKRSRICRASEQFSRMSLKWRAHHLQLNGEEPIMRRKTPLSNKKEFSDPICSP